MDKPKISSQSLDLQYRQPQQKIRGARKVQKGSRKVKRMAKEKGKQRLGAAPKEEPKERMVWHYETIPKAKAMAYHGTTDTKKVSKQKEIPKAKDMVHTIRGDTPEIRPGAVGHHRTLPTQGSQDHHTVGYSNRTGPASITHDDRTDGSHQVKEQDTLHHTPVQVHQPQANGMDRNAAIIAHEAVVAKAPENTTDQTMDITVIQKERDVLPMVKVKDNTWATQVHQMVMDQNIQKDLARVKAKDTGGEKEKEKEKHILPLLQ